ncbi:hypothetical protein [Yinghuangia seranimata]|uniref:hypothetical protein n=1 Tax=Yinghuangia seranimata TaxID=408067 RepID=UPI00248C668D|nr:hypothetical protein [Yinghuangia seranimata]MDI2131587.1 hypothetical protein [Yinghuangia seranimata]
MGIVLHVLTAVTTAAGLRLRRLGVVRRFPFTRVARLLPRLLRICAGVLVVWIGVLVVELGRGAGKRSFDTSWIGLDLAEVAALLMVARLVAVRHRATGPAAAMTATLLGLDAWFDYMSAAPQLEYLQAMVLAVFVELPLAALLAWVSLRTLDWAAPMAGAAEAEPRDRVGGVR